MVDSSGIRKVFELAAKIEDPVNLSIGQPDFDVPELAKEAAIEAIQQGHNRYTLTQGIPELRERVSQYLYETRHKNFSKDQILVSSGVSGGLMLALMSILDPDDEVIFFDPYFVMYKHLINLIGGKPVIVDSYPDFRLDAAKLEAAISDKTKAIVLNSPSNPTGYVYSSEEIQAAVKVAKKHNIMIISDEIYDSFLYDGNFDSPARYTDNIVLLGGFSKTYAMTGWRLGYAAGREDVITQMIKLQQYSFVCAPAPFQYAAVKAMDLDVTPYVDAYREKRNLIYEGLKDDFDVVKPGGAFYIFPGLKQGSADEFVEKAISEKALIIPGNVFSEKNTHFRISFATTNDKLKQGVEILVRTARTYYQGKA